MNNELLGTGETCSSLGGSQEILAFAYCSSILLLQVPDTFQFSNLINESEEIVSVASNSSKQDWVGGIEGGDAKIFALAQRQAGREEALASALKMNQRLEAEILDLEREVKLREEQEAVLKKALRDADRRQHQQDGLLENSIDMEYLKNTVVKLLETGEAEALLPVLARLLKLSVEEEGAVRVSLKATNDVSGMLYVAQQLNTHLPQNICL